MGSQHGDKIKATKREKKKRECMPLWSSLCLKPKAEGVLVLSPLIPWSGSSRSQVACRLEVARKSAINHPTWSLTRRFVHHLY